MFGIAAAIYVYCTYVFVENKNLKPETYISDGLPSDVYDFISVFNEYTCSPLATELYLDVQIEAKDIVLFSVTYSMHIAIYVIYTHVIFEYKFYLRIH